MCMQMLKNNLNKGEIKMKKTTTYKVTAYNKDGDYYDTLYSDTSFSECFKRAEIYAELCEKDKLRARSGEPYDWVEIFDDTYTDLIWASYLPQR